MSRSLWGEQKLIFSFLFFKYWTSSDSTIITGQSHEHFRWNNGKTLKIYFGRDKSFCMIEVQTYVVETWRLQLVYCVSWSAVVEVLSAGCEAFGFNLLGKEEWLGWLICQQDTGWLNQGERRGMESFWKGNDGFCSMYLYFKGSKLKSTFLFSILTKGCKKNLSFLREGRFLLLGISVVI